MASQDEASGKVHFHHLVYHWLPLLIFAALIFYFSSRSTLPGFVSALPINDKILHLGEFFIFGLLIFRAFSTTKYEPIVYLVVILAAFLYGLFDEFHQLFVPGRVFSIFDLAADTLGGAIAILAIELKDLFKTVFSPASESPELSQ